MSEEIFASGSAWVGASVQTVGLDGFPGGEGLGLRGWDPERYGSLSILHDDASFDIFTQIAQAVGPDRPGASGAGTSVAAGSAGSAGSAGAAGSAGVDPMGGLPVTRLLAMGESQSASRLGTYYNAIQPVSQCFDGFLITVFGGGGTRVEAAGPGPSLEAIPPELRPFMNIMPFGSSRLRDDLPTPALVLNSETEAPWYRAVRQPDTATFRFWEIAGAAHLSDGVGEETEGAWSRDLGAVPPIPLLDPLEGPPNSLSYEPVVDAALHHLWPWMAGGDPPPIQDRLVFAGDPPELARDEHGNVLGGIRLPDLAAPTASHRGASAGEAPDLVGSSVPFTSQTLGELYPTHADYMTRYDHAVDEGLARGFLLEADATRLRERAATAPVPPTS
jgi:Alpha/beta hydrolase domain